ncbi:GNAT family N-acetyltransferase [Rhodobacteraceae bacterium NNCM2]|nr:GNAT family N-acetyltransferase [Coraliihabitans acroporae]
MNDHLPSSARLMEAMDATWPPAETAVRGGWTLRRGAGGGQRVSSARGMGDLQVAEDAMRAWGQAPIFCVTPEEVETDAMLERAGYRIHDPVVLYAASAQRIADGSDETAKVIRCTTPLRLVDELWEQGGIGPGRRAVMERAGGPKTVLMSRVGDRPSGCAFVACDREVAMIHAIEVHRDFRRHGSGERLLLGAASWAVENGAAFLALAVTCANAPARRLYEKMGMAEAGRYHYRVQPEG